jgi:hypothetical protein
MTNGKGDMMYITTAANVYLRALRRHHIATHPNKPCPIPASIFDIPTMKDRKIFVDAMRSTLEVIADEKKMREAIEATKSQIN